MKKLLFLILILLVLGCKTSEKIKEEPFANLNKIVDQYAENTLKKGNINSLAIAIYRDGEVYQNYYGEIDHNLNNPPNDKTLFEVASISKIFLGSLTAKAVLEHKIKLNDDIRIYLQPDKYSNLEYENTPITIKNLLTHTLGFKNKTPKKLEEVNKKTNEFYYENRPFDYTISDLLEELKTVSLDKKPGTVYNYNAVGPELVAYILEKVYHKPYSVLLTDFFKELDLKNTYLQDYDNHKKFLANSYGQDRKRAPLLKNPLLGGAYGIITTLPDLTKFLKFQLESKNPLIKESTQFLFKDDENDTGYFWDLGIGKKEGFYYGKTGTSNGVQSGILVCPDSDYGLVIIMNNNSDEALNDWTSLYNRIETNLIVYPKINLVSLLQKEFIINPEKTFEKYKKIKTDTINYASGSTYLNELGYELINRINQKKRLKFLN